MSPCAGRPLPLASRPLHERCRILGIQASASRAPLQQAPPLQRLALGSVALRM
ncbi:hypothetical protein AURDEDRAFT_112904, partial [Auricularia subglabra TFB-10046 SS5]